MNDKKLAGIFPALLRLALTICLVWNVIPGSGAQEKPQETKPEHTNKSNISGQSATAEKEAPSASKPSEAPAEGIKVHGHWKLVVKNTDGSVASTNEFENSLQVNGNLLLGGLLSGQYVMGPWTVSLSVQTSPNSIGGLSLSEFSGSLTVTNSSGVSLTGTTKSSQGGSIVLVSSSAGYCPTSSMTPAACLASGAGSFVGFTSHTLTSPIAVQANQSIDVTVTITFS